MKRWFLLTLAMFALIGCQSSTFAGTKHKPPAKVAEGPVYVVNITAGAWEGVSTRVKLTLAGHTAIANSLRVNGLKSGLYTATVSLLNTEAGAQIQTVLEYTMYAYGGAIEVISVGDFTYPNPFFAPHENYDLSMAWGKDVSQIPGLPLGEDSFARYRIGDTCKIVFFVGPPNTTLQDVALLVANSGGTKDKPKAPSDTKINWNTIYNWEATPQEAMTMSVPNNHGVVVGTSGPTIAHGVDLGQKGHDKTWLNSLHLDTSLSAMLSPYLGMTGQSALDYVTANPLTLTQDQVNQIDQAVQPIETSAVIKKCNADVGNNQAFQTMPEAAETVYTSVYYQYYNLASITLSDIENGDYNGAISELRNTEHWEHPLMKGLQNRRNLDADYLQSAINRGDLPGTHQ